MSQPAADAHGPKPSREWRSRISAALEPTDAVVGEEARRRARYTRGSISVIVPLGVVAFLLTSRFGQAETLSPTTYLIIASTMVLSALWPMSRGRHHDLVAFLAVTVTGATVALAWILAGAETGDADTLYFLSLPVWISSLLLPRRHATWIGVSAVSLTTLELVYAAASDQPGWDHLLPVPLLIAIAAGLSWTAAGLRSRDLKRADELAAELRAQERRRVEMLNTIAHDLASPLTPLKLQVRLIPKDKPVAPASLAIVERNLKQMERLVTDVKELARHEAGELSVRKAPIDLAEIARAAHDAFEEDARARGVRLEASLDGPAPVDGDAERLTQVAYNLITNALKFTPQGGVVRIAARVEDHRGVLMVQDSGRGLTPPEIARLFRPFSQVHERSEVKERGTGLGLYISRGIAQAHGGELSVASEGHGHGSVFTLALPARREG